MTEDQFHEWLSNPHRPCLLMGVLNVTPDSFSDGGKFYDAAAAIDEARRMSDQGASIIDIGGESTRPGSQRIEAEEQLRRIMPVFEAIAGRVSAVLSVDTTRSEVARAAIECGARIVNDVSAGRDDPLIFPLVAQNRAAMILMHMQGQPATMQVDPRYEDVTQDVKGFLSARLQVAQAAGIPAQDLLVDPGIGFGKTLWHNLQLLRELAHLEELGHPIVIGTSRKGFIGRLTDQKEPSDRLIGTAATVAWSVANGGSIVRVHDVAAMAQVVRIVRAIQSGSID